MGLFRRRKLEATLGLKEKSKLQQLQIFLKKLVIELVNITEKENVSNKIWYR